MAGPDRTILYRLAVEAGLRSSEIRSLTRESFTLAGEMSCVMVKAAYSKRRKEDRVPLRPEMVEAMRPMLAKLEAGERVFKMPRKENVARMLRQDLEAAGIPYRDAGDKVADFHALRHTCGSWLMAANVHPKIIQQVMRHSTIKLTMDRYTHVFRGDEAKAVDQFPALTGPQEPAGESVFTTSQSAETEAERRCVPLGALGTKTCDSGRSHETERAIDQTESAQEKSPHSLEKQGKTDLKRRGRDYPHPLYASILPIMICATSPVPVPICASLVESG